VLEMKEKCDHTVPYERVLKRPKNLTLGLPIHRQTSQHLRALRIHRLNDAFGHLIQLVQFLRMTLSPGAKRY